MFPRWLWLNHVPADMKLSREEFVAVRDRVRAMGPGQRRFTDTSKRMLKHLLPTLGAIIGAFFIWLYWLITYQPSGRTMVLLNVTGILLFNLAVWISIAWSIHRAVRPLVWKALNQIGRRTCEGCGYILEYLPTDVARCPECGEAQTEFKPT